jgi:hypothetical protein
VNLELSLYSTCQAQSLRGLSLSPVSELLHTYLLSAKVDVKSLFTIDSYRERLSIFFRFLEVNRLPLDPAKLNSIHLRLFLGHIRDKNLGSTIINAYYRDLHMFSAGLLRIKSRRIIHSRI